MGSIEEIVLPDSVEKIISRICQEKNLPPPKDYARKMLADIGEEASVKLLLKILSSAKIKTFSGYIRFLVMKDFPIQGAAVLVAFGFSPETQKTGSPSSNSPFNSPYKQNGESMQSPLSNSPRNFASSSFRRSSTQNVRCHLSFENETPERSSPSGRNQSSNGDGITKTVSPQLMILAKLEYRKLFLVLSYIGREKLEAVIGVDSANEIFSMKDLPMGEFEERIWNTYGQRFCSKSERSMFPDWDSGKTHLYYCHADRDGSYYFKGPYLNSTRTHLQRSLGDENILIVKFLEDGEYSTSNILADGIFVGLRRFRYFVFKDERKRAKKNPMEERKTTSAAVKCYFVRTDSVVSSGEDENYILYGKTITDARRLFMHINTVSTIEKYMARFSLILSKTIKLQLDFDVVKIETIEDIPFQDANGSFIYGDDGKPLLHTDGTGYISEDLALKCPKDFSSAKYTNDNSFEGITCQKTGVEARKEPPLLMQIRLFHQGCAVKGTLLVNRKVGMGTIQIRPSMVKVERDPTLSKEETINSLEIVSISHKPGRNYLSKNLIALLSYGGVPRQFFLDLLVTCLEETRNVYSDRRAALRVASNHDGLDIGFVAQRMILSGIPLNEPHLQNCLSRLENEEKSQLKNGKIPIAESFYLMGTADPTGILNNDEVCVILDNGQISGTVLVYRNPGIHFGDIHILKAVYVKGLEDIVGNAKYGIFFCAKGSKSAAYEMASGDFDGDMYWVSRNPELLKHYKASEPWSRVHSTPASNKRGPQEYSSMELERELFQIVLQARKPSFDLATASNSWRSFMDRLLTLGDGCASEKDCLRKKMIHLIDIYYDALDAPKSGKKVDLLKELKPEMYPHHMGMAHNSYKSYSILGQIYDKVMEFKSETVTKKEIWKLPSFDIPNIETYINLWKSRYDDYRKEMSKAMNSGDESKNEAANDVIKKYKQLLYDAPEMEESGKNSQVIYEEAIAIYHVVYDYATTINGVEKCGFAWRVAGSALCDYFAWKLAGPKEKPMVIVSSVLRELLY